MVRALAVVVPLLLLTFFSISHAAWTDDGNIVCSAATHQYGPVATPDGAGGAFIAWTDPRTDTGDIYIQRVNSAGVAQWAANGVAVCSATGAQDYVALVADGAGGVIVAWSDVRGATFYDIYAQRLNGAGVPQWAANGVAVCVAARGQYYPKLADNGAGGAIVTWYDDRASNADVYAARLSASGLTADSPNGVAISTGATSETPSSIMPFGAGGALIAWTDARHGAFDIYAARFSSAGTLLDAAGIPVCQAAGDQEYPACVSDAAGGAIIAWSDSRLETIYAQRVNASGVIQWGVSGLPVGDGGTGAIFQLPQVVADGAGGAIISWMDFDGDYDIYAQRVNGAGARQWVPNDIYVCNQGSEQRTPVIAPDESGGAVIAWRDKRNLFTGYDVFAQRVNGAGAAQWTANGVAVCDDVFDQDELSLVSDGSGGVICAWKDKRDFQNYDIYAMRVGSSGQTPTTVREAAVPAFDMSAAWPNPFSGETSFDVRSDWHSNVVVNLFDAAGRRVRSLSMASPAASRRIVIDGLDDRGRTLPSGVYFCRVEVGDAVRSQKLILVR